MRAALMVTLALAAACGGAKAPPPERGGQPAGAAQTTPESAVPGPRATPPVGTPAGGRAVMNPAEANPPPPPPPPSALGRPLRDSAFGPKGAVDSSGKVVPLRKPPE